MIKNNEIKNFEGEFVICRNYKNIFFVEEIFWSDICGWVFYGDNSTMYLFSKFKKKFHLGKCLLTEKKLQTIL